MSEGLRLAVEENVKKDGKVDATPLVKIKYKTVQGSGALCTRFQQSNIIPQTIVSVRVLWTMCDLNWNSSLMCSVVE